MIRNESVTVLIGGTQIYPDSVKITCGVGKGYNTCSMSLVDAEQNNYGNVGDTVNVQINADTFVFLLTEKTYSEKGKVSLECKGIPFVLENQSPSDDLLEYVSSDTLIENERGSVVVSNNLPTINFNGQSYSKSNTPMGRIADMVSVVGGEMYEHNSTLHLQELQTIGDTPVIAQDLDSEKIFSYSYSDKISNSILLNEVLVNPITDNIYSSPSITVEYDEDNRTANCFFNPSLSTNDSYSFMGMKPNPPSMTTKVETTLVSSASQISTIGGIDTVNYITVDGEPFADYETYSPHNVVRFTTLVSGEVKISYTTKNIIAFVNSTTNFLIQYKCVKSEGTIEIDDTSTVSSQNCKVDIQSPLTYEDGGSVKCYADNNLTLVFAEQKGNTNIEVVKNTTHAGGGNLIIKYTHGGSAWANTAFMNSISSSVASEIETTSGTVTYNEELDKYIVELPAKILGINSVLEGSVGLTGYTYVDDDVPYISFQASDVDRVVDISYNVNIATITIPAPNQGHRVRFMDAVGCGGVATQEFVNSDGALCSIPATFRIDVADNLNATISQVHGVTVTGDGGIGAKIVDEYGKIEVTIDSAILYTIDCGNIKSNAKIFIDARGVTGA